ncbi:MAG TPA: hypothetical protein VLA43_00930 [Longimicrobiales bacterium]|nr:hypothetical protein [Longimicrobiales bacterium]
MLRPCLALATVLTFAACGGDSGTNPDPGGNGGGNNGGSDRVVKADPSFGSDIQEIFNRTGCSASSCHGAAESAGLRLTTGESYGELVNVQATSEPVVRVIPGDATGSYLVIKLEGRQTVGARMPEGGTPLDAIDMGNIRNWINQGAKNN